jgi:glycosyltransferase involved in cell wall biosynthesis
VKVLLSAYACEPGKGSEPEVGLRMMLAAAERHSVWVLTRQNNVEPLENFLRDHPLKKQITIVGFDSNARHLRLKRLMGRFGTLWYYDRWQGAIRDLASALDTENDFDVVHHITLAAYWGRLGVGHLQKPLVVGPVGGAATSPIRLLPTLGLSGVTGEIARRLVRPLVARVTGARQVQREAAAIVAQNKEAAEAIGAPASRTTILPNGLIGATDEDPGPPVRTDDVRFIFAGRLAAWKGPHLAIRALAHYPSTTAVLEIYGSGRPMGRLVKEAAKLGLGDRVIFPGAVSRPELLDRLASSSALIHPALHDDSPLIVAEALSVGTPVVYLDRAGPPVIAGFWPSAISRPVSPSTPRRTAIALADALTQVVGTAGPHDGSPARRFTDGMLDIYERVVDQPRV